MVETLRAGMWIKSPWFLAPTHPDTEEQSDEKDWNGEEEEEHEEPCTPVEPVAETHHPHVLLKGKRKKKAMIQDQVCVYRAHIEKHKHTFSFLSFSWTTARTMLRDV